MQMEEGVIHRGLLHILRKPNSIVALLFFQNNSKNLLTSVDVIGSASLSGSLGDKGVLRSAN